MDNGPDDAGTGDERQAYIDELVAQAPPLDPQQRDQLAVLLRAPHVTDADTA